MGFNVEDFFKDVFWCFANDINDINEVRLAKNYLDKVAEIDKYRNTYFYMRVAPEYREQTFSFYNNSPNQNRSIVDRDYDKIQQNIAFYNSNKKIRKICLHKFTLYTGRIICNNS